MGRIIVLRGSSRADATTVATRTGQWVGYCLFAKAHRKWGHTVHEGADRRTVRKAVFTIAALVAIALAACAAAEDAIAPGADLETRHTTADLANWIEPNGWQDPVVTASTVDQALEPIPPPPGEAGSGFPLDQNAHDGSDAAAVYESGAYVNGTYVDGAVMDTPYDRVCAPHDPLQPRCRYTDDFMWGCGGSPFRHGPGTCDTWRVGCRWDSWVDGMVLWREDANLDGIIAATNEDSFGNAQFPIQFTDQFNYGPGGRLSVTGKVPRYVGYRVHFGYEGVEEWNASVIYPKFFLDPATDPPTVLGPMPDPPPDVPFFTEQRRVHYRSSFHSGEMNIVRCYHTSQWQPYCGVRYVKFDDELRDFIDQQSQAPLPDGVASVVTTDRLNLFDLENNMIGFQIGVRRDIWRINRRLSVQGFVNGGVYHNEIKRTNLMVFATEELFDDGSEVRTTANNEVSEIDDIAFLGEASISGVCRLNRCCAMRAGYQMLWIDGLRLAEDAFLFGDDISRELFFHGWHAGLEYRR